MARVSVVRPRRLVLNDRVAVVAPSQPARASVVERAAATVRMLGLEPIICESCYAKDNGNESCKSHRAEDVNQAFADGAISGLIALRAGSGTLSVLPHLDYDVIRRNPKVVLGFSDITGLHLALNTLCNLVTFYGPVAMTNMVQGRDGRGDLYTVESIRMALFDSSPIGQFVNPALEDIDCLSPGVGRGWLVGGTLSVIAQTLGTRYEIQAEKRILFIEDYGEKIDDISTMLQTLGKSGHIGACNGIVLGTWIRCGEEYESADMRKRRFDEMFQDVLGPYKKPVIANVRAGHCTPMATLPLGVEVEINADARTLIFIESATRE